MFDALLRIPTLGVFFCQIFFQTFITLFGLMDSNVSFEYGLNIWGIFNYQSCDNKIILEACLNAQICT